MYVVVDDLRIEALRMAQHTIHEFRALQPFDITGPVIDIRRGHQLTALFHTGDDDRIEVGAGGIDGRRVTGRARAQNQNPVMF
jgi:hypothetical protein